MRPIPASPLVPFATLALLTLLAFPAPPPAFAQGEKEIPIIVEEDASAPEAGKKAEIVSDAPKAAKRKPAEAGKAAPAAGADDPAASEAKKLRSGESLAKLVKIFVKYRPDAAFDPAAVDEGAEGFDAARADALKADITAWKKLRLEAKAAKGKDAAKFEKKYQEVRALETRILAEYGKGGKPAAEAEAGGKAAGREAATDAGTTAGLAAGATTAEAKRVIERAGKPAGEGAEGVKAGKGRDADDEADRVAARDDSEARIEKVRKEREGSKYMPAKIRWRPTRVLFNRLEPGGSERSVFTLRNAGRTPFEGAIVAIEDWISVSPPTVLVEPNAEIEIDVQVKAPDKKNVRTEGSIEIRSVGESSRRVPVVLRTVRK